MNSLFITVKVVPQSGKQVCTIDAQGALKCFLKSARERGKANKELIAVLASLFKVPQHAIEIIKGHTTRIKRIKIETTLAKKELLKNVLAEVQSAIF